MGAERTEKAIRTPAPRPYGLARVLAALVIFGVSFGFVEAAVVTYLRALYDPLHQRIYPESTPGDIFPLITLEQLAREGPEHSHRLFTELVREAATLVMLAAVSLAFAANAREWWAGFMIAFGVWDIFFYLFLKVLLDWPDSLLAWDILFLVPIPWVGPVLAPVLVSLSMIMAGVIVLQRESAGRPVRLGWQPKALITAGGVIVVLALCWDFHNTSSGGMPHPFHWTLFLLGEVTGLSGLVLSNLSSRPRTGGSKQILPRSKS